MKDQSSASLAQEKFLPVTVYEPRQCEHAGCLKLGLFGFLQRHEPHWFCYEHKEIGEQTCRQTAGAAN